MQHRGPESQRPWTAFIGNANTVCGHWEHHGDAAELHVLPVPPARSVGSGYILGAHRCQQLALWFSFLFVFLLFIWNHFSLVERSVYITPRFAWCYYLMWLVHIPQAGNRVWISLTSFFCSAVQSETPTWHLVLMSPSSLVCDSPSFLALRHLDTFEERWSVIRRMSLVGICGGVSWLDARSHFWWEEHRVMPSQVSCHEVDEICVSHWWRYLGHWAKVERWCFPSCRVTLLPLVINMYLGREGLRPCRAHGSPEAFTTLVSVLWCVLPTRTRVLGVSSFRPPLTGCFCREDLLLFSHPFVYPISYSYQCGLVEIYVMGCSLVLSLLCHSDSFPLGSRDPLRLAPVFLTCPSIFLALSSFLAP